MGAGFNAEQPPYPAKRGGNSEERTRCVAWKPRPGRRRRAAYHKTRHLPDILGKLNTATVRERAWHCDRIFVTLAKKLGAELPPLCKLAPEP